jgi:hypothetical protein
MEMPKTNPPTESNHWRMDLGSYVHEMLQSAVMMALPNALHEYEVDMNSIDIPGSARVDLLAPVGNLYEGVEIKSINGMGFKSTATPWLKTGYQGPRESHVIQAATNTAAVHAAGEYKMKGARIVYLSLELVSPKEAKRMNLDDRARFCAEWVIPLEQCQEIAEREARRLARMRKQMDAGEWVEPVIPTKPLDNPGKIKVTNPRSGAAIDMYDAGDKTWACDYCDYKDQCISDHVKAELILPPRKKDDDAE